MSACKSLQLLARDRVPRISLCVLSPTGPRNDRASVVGRIDSILPARAVWGSQIVTATGVGEEVAHAPAPRRRG